MRMNLTSQRIYIDKDEVKRRMDMLGIGSYRQLADRTAELGDENAVSLRTLYNIIGSDRWYSNMLYSIAAVLECSPLELLSADVTADQGKAPALAHLSAGRHGKPVMSLQPA